MSKYAESILRDALEDLCNADQDDVSLEFQNSLIWAIERALEQMSPEEEEKQ